MKQKVSTLIDSALFHRVKLEAVVRNKQISEIFGEALNFYLREHGTAPATASAVASSWGALRLEPAEIHRMLEEEDGLFDA